VPEVRVYPTGGLGQVTASADAFALQLISRRGAEMKYADLLPLVRRVLPKVARAAASQAASVRRITAELPRNVELPPPPVFDAELDVSGVDEIIEIIESMSPDADASELDARGLGDGEPDDDVGTMPYEAPLIEDESLEPSNLVLMEQVVAAPELGRVVWIAIRDAASAVAGWSQSAGAKLFRVHIPALVSMAKGPKAAATRATLREFPLPYAAGSARGPRGRIAPGMVSSEMVLRPAAKRSAGATARRSK